MDADGLPIVGTAVDLTKVVSIHHKRTLAFLNHFVCHTANFLNKFSSVCESKLEDINIRIQRVETALCILESKLSSIPGLEDVVLTNKISDQDSTNEIEQQSTIPQPISRDSPITGNHIKEKDQVVEDKNTGISKPNLITVSQHPRYAKYSKLLQMGVPLMAFQSKMIDEGLKPNLLETPNATIPFSSEDRVSDSITESESGSEISD